MCNAGFTTALVVSSLCRYVWNIFLTGVFTAITNGELLCMMCRHITVSAGSWKKKHLFA